MLSNLLSQKSQNLKLRLEVNKIKGFLNMKVELNKKEIDILISGLLELNHRLINDLVKTATTADCEQVKNRIIEINFLIDKLHV